MNQELFKKIHRITESTPGSLWMDSWEGTIPVEGCGTTRCIAGWAIHLTTGEPLFTRGGNHHSSMTALAEQMGVRDDFEELGAAVLGISAQIASIAFYLNNTDGPEFVRLMAEGDEAAAERLAWEAYER